MSDLYILASDGRTPVRMDSVEEWSRWHREHPTAGNVQTTLFPVEEKNLIAETKFWGSELNPVREMNPRAPSYVFRTNVFDDGVAIIQEQCSTWEQAEAQHQGVLDVLRARRKSKAALACGSPPGQYRAFQPDDECVLQT